MVGYIYKITNPSGKIYIGKTTDLPSRISKYKYLNCKNQTRILASLIKYGWTNHTFEVIDTILVFDDNLDILEMYYIDLYNSFIFGLNCTLGGDGQNSRVCSQTTREKMKNSQLGKKQSIETITKRVQSLRGQKRSQEFRDNQRNNRLGITMSEETKEKLRQINLGKASPNRVSSKLTNLITNEIWEASSLLELSKISPLSISAIGRLKSGKSGNRVTKIYKLEYN